MELQTTVEWCAMALRKQWAHWNVVQDLSLAPKKGVFYIGSKNFNCPLFDRPWKSKGHINVVQAFANKQASREETSSRPLARWRDKQKSKPF